jgi:hypothetical protein
MSQTVIELRKAAASARAFAENIQSAELKRSFREMAGRWEKEADERDDAESRMEGPEHFSKVPRSRKH